MPAALRQAPGIDPADFRVVSAQSFLPVKAHQAASPGGAEDYVVRGLDARVSHPHDLRPRGAREGVRRRMPRCGAR